MKITAIKQQVRQQGRYSIFVEGKYSFSLSDTALLNSKIVSGQELTANELTEYQKLSVDDKLYGRVLQYLAIRPRSTWEIEFYLKRKKVDPLLSQDILNRLSNMKLLNDEAFARSWLASRRLLKPVSSRRILQELQVKHISKEIAERVLQDDETDDKATLRELISKKQLQTRYQDRTKLMQYLVRQGYRYDDIKQAFAEPEFD